MEIENLLKLRNLLEASSGLFIEYMQDYITNQACLNRNAEQIKGMCELVEQIKRIPQRVEAIRSKK